MHRHNQEQQGCCAEAMAKWCAYLKHATKNKNEADAMHALDQITQLLNQLSEEYKR